MARSQPRTACCHDLNGAFKTFSIQGAFLTGRVRDALRHVTLHVGATDRRAFATRLTGEVHLIFARGAITSAFCV